MQLCIRLLNQRHPKLLRVRTVAIERCLRSNVVRYTSVNLDELPEAIFEKPENCKSELDAIMED